MSEESKSSPSNFVERNGFWLLCHRTVKHYEQHNKVLSFTVLLAVNSVNARSLDTYLFCFFWKLSSPSSLSPLSSSSSSFFVFVTSKSVRGSSRNSPPNPVLYPFSVSHLVFPDLENMSETLETGCLEAFYFLLLSESDLLAVLWQECVLVILLRHGLENTAYPL